MSRKIERRQGSLWIALQEEAIHICLGVRTLTENSYHQRMIHEFRTALHPYNYTSHITPTVTMFPSIHNVMSVPSTQALRSSVSTRLLKTTYMRVSQNLSTAAPFRKPLTLLQDKENGFGFARSNPRPPKPRSRGVTEIRGPYYTVCQKTLSLLLPG
jgi:hypothetical protein